MILLADIHAVWMFLAGVGLLTFILMKRSYRYFSRPRRKRNDKPIELQPRPKGPWDGVQHDAMAHVERQKVEMFEMSRDLNGQLNSKIIVLEKLIADSQRQITRMEALLAQIDDTPIDGTQIDGVESGAAAPSSLE
jgi:hypothetical protein